MRKKALINFFKEEKREEKYFKCTVIILIYLLIFQSYISIKSINNLKEEINNTKTIVQSNVAQKVEKKKSTLVNDTNEIYNLLGFSNVERLSVENNKVSIEGKCKSLEILDKLKSMDNIKNFSVTNVENKNNKLYFHAIYEIGGFE